MPDSKPTQGQKDVSLLSDNEIRIAIAKFHGWIFEAQGDSDYVQFHREGKHSVMRYFPDGSAQDTKDRLDMGGIPDYCHDLNAMHEAEEVMTREQKDEYWLRLCREVVPLNQRAWRSTARQRAEAFVLTMTK